MFEAEMHRYDRICYILWPLHFHDELANYGFKEGVVYTTPGTPSTIVFILLSSLHPTIILIIIQRSP